MTDRKPKSPLTLTELAVGKLIIEGMTSSEIGERLVMSKRTAEKHAERIKSKLEARSRAALILSLHRLINEPDAEPANVISTTHRTSLIRRAVEVTEISGLIATTPLISIVGSPGVGKTRIALRVAEDARTLGAFSDGVCVVELAAVNRADFLAEAIARACHVDLSHAAEPVGALIRALSHREMLMLLDNCEHLIDSCADIIAALLTAAPRLRVIVTSRNVLRIAGERVYAVQPLSVPSVTVMRVEDAERYGALLLFAECARASDPSFALAQSNVEPIVAICRRVSGVPLFVEIAAALIATLTPQQILAGFDESYTVNASLDQSFRLLTDGARAMFCRLSVFRGGWTLNAAEAVCLGEEASDVNVFDVMASLIESWLIVADMSTADTRYDFHESIRQYARERLEAAGELDIIGDRHASFFAATFTSAGQDYAATFRQSGVLALQCELSNVRTAMEWAVRRGRPEVGATIFATTPLWSLAGLPHEALRWANTFLANVPTANQSLIARLWMRARRASYGLGDNIAAWEASTYALAAASAGSDPLIRANALAQHAFIAVITDRTLEAQTVLDEAERALTEAIEAGLPTMETRFAVDEALAALAMAEKDFDRVVIYYARTINTCRAIDNHTGEVVCTLNLADAEQARGNTTRAIALLERILPRAQGVPRPDLQAGVLRSLAALYAAANDIQRAKSVARQAIGLLIACDRHPAMIASAIEHLALALLLDGETDRPARLAGYCGGALREANRSRTPTEQISQDRLMELLRSHMEAEELNRLLSEGAALSSHAAAAEALSVEWPAT